LDKNGITIPNSGINRIRKILSSVICGLFVGASSLHSKKARHIKKSLPNLSPINVKASTNVETDCLLFYERLIQLCKAHHPPVVRSELLEGYSISQKREQKIQRQFYAL